MADPKPKFKIGDIVESIYNDTNRYEIVDCVAIRGYNYQYTVRIIGLDSNGLKNYHTKEEYLRIPLEQKLSWI